MPLKNKKVSEVINMDTDKKNYSVKHGKESVFSKRDVLVKLKTKRGFK